MNRRQFAAQLAAVTSLAALPDARGLQAPPPEQSFDVGLELYSLRREMAADLPGTLIRAREMGFREVEVPSYYGLTVAEFRKALDRAALRATALVAQWDVLEKGISSIANDLDVLGASWAILPWIPHEDRFERSDTLEAAKRMNAWAADLEQAGYHFAYHPHGYEFQPAPEGTLFDVLAAKTDAMVSFEMDTFWIAWPGQDCVRLLNKYPHRFPSSPSQRPEERCSWQSFGSRTRGRQRCRWGWLDFVGGSPECRSTARLREVLHRG